MWREEKGRERGEYLEQDEILCTSMFKLSGMFKPLHITVAGTWRGEQMTGSDEEGNQKQMVSIYNANYIYSQFA